MSGKRGDYGTRNAPSHRRMTVTPLPTNENAPRKGAGSMEQACVAAFGDMAWLRDSDEIAKQLILKYAQLLDGPEGAYMAMRLGPHLLDVLKQVAATPYTRMMLFGNEKTVSGKLAELRSKRGA